MQEDPDNGTAGRVNNSPMHQHICPHCRNASVPNLAVRWSSRESPAECAACGQLSHVVSSTSSGIWVFGVLLVVASGIAALVTQSLWVGLAGLALMVACNVCAWRRTELWPISKTDARTANKVGWWAAIGAWVVALFVN